MSVTQPAENAINPQPTSMNFTVRRMIFLPNVRIEKITHLQMSVKIDEHITVGDNK
jgi:hypothetical protein